MKPMIWHPEDKDSKVNAYLDNLNHAPYITIMILLTVAFCLFTMLTLVGIF